MEREWREKIIERVKRTGRKGEGRGKEGR